MIFTWNLVDGDMEILPRPQTRQGIVKDWRGIKGVAGGFALLGRQSSGYIVAHYDWLTRACTVHENGLSTAVPAGLAYVRHCHSVVLLNLFDQLPLLAIDLATGMFAYDKDINQLERRSARRATSSTSGWIRKRSPTQIVAGAARSRRYATPKRSGLTQASDCTSVLRNNSSGQTQKMHGIVLRLMARSRSTIVASSGMSSFHTLTAGKFLLKDKTSVRPPRGNDLGPSVRRSRARQRQKTRAGVLSRSGRTFPQGNKLDLAGG